MLGNHRPGGGWTAAHTVKSVVESMTPNASRRTAVLTNDGAKSVTNSQVKIYIGRFPDASFGKPKLTEVGQTRASSRFLVSAAVSSAR
jgi:hypothetical protein